MIEFAKITQTLDGYDCHYFGTRMSNGRKLHCFGVWTTTGLYEKCYDENGKHLVWNYNEGEFIVSDQPDFQIVKPPKIVEVTRWVALYGGKGSDDGFFVCTYRQEPGKAAINTPDLLCKFQHTFRFEVPNE